MVRGKLQKVQCSFLKSVVRNPSWNEIMLIKFRNKAQQQQKQKRKCALFWILNSATTFSVLNSRQTSHIAISMVVENLNINANYEVRMKREKKKVEKTTINGQKKQKDADKTNWTDGQTTWREKQYECQTDRSWPFLPIKFTSKENM